MSAELQERARDVINRRRRRGDYFPVAMFDEIGWEILLTLYAFDEPIHTGALVAHRLRSPPSTSDRWIDYLVSQDLVVRQTEPEDRRAAAIALTRDGRQRIEEYLSGLAP